MKTITRLVPAALLLAASTAFADCGRPDSPDIPEGASATEEQMMAGQDAVKVYMEGTNEFLNCMTEEARQEGDTDTPEKEEKRVNEYNQAVEDMEKVAEQFNTEVRAWKAQSAE